jgi:hypothetical protein
MISAGIPDCGMPADVVVSVDESDPSRWDKGNVMRVSLFGSFVISLPGETRSR